MTTKELLQNSEIKAAKKVDNNTYKIEYKDGRIAYRLHNTDVVTTTEKAISLNSGGWHTVTTKERLNRFSPFRISQNKGLWYVHTPSGTFDFFDGITFNKDGKPDKEIKTDTKEIDKIKKQISKFVSLITKDNLPVPESGDCWLCSFHTKDGQSWGDLREGDTDHLLSHLEEGYLHGSLLVNAMRAKGYNDMQIGLHYSMKLADTFKRAVRQYLQKKLIINIAVK